MLSNILHEDCCYYEIDSVKTGECIKRYLFKTGISVRKLASSLCVSNQTVYKWLNGQCLPTLTNLYQISKLCRVPMDELIVGGDECHYSVSSTCIRETFIYSVC